MNKYKDGFYRADPSRYMGGTVYCKDGMFFCFGWECELKPNTEGGGDTLIHIDDIGPYIGPIISLGKA